MTDVRRTSRRRDALPLVGSKFVTFTEDNVQQCWAKTVPAPLGQEEDPSMRKMLIGLVTLPFLTGGVMAGQPTLLNDVHMDKVTAGDLAKPPVVIVSDVQLYQNVVIPPHDHEPTPIFGFTIPGFPFSPLHLTTTLPGQSVIR